MNEILKVRNLSKGKILKDINFEMQEGEMAESLHLPQHDVEPRDYLRR